MHIPDGFLSAPVWLSLDVASVPAIGYLARRAQREFDDTRLPLLGIMGAFVFAAQMINFPVGLGTSGHLVGAALLAIALGPAAAAIVMTAILGIQAFVFQDGGVLALGANVLNMALAGVLAGYLPYRIGGAGRFRKASIFLAGAASVLVAAILATAELMLSAIAIPRPLLLLSLAVFAITAVLEGAITLAIVQGIEAVNPGFVRPAARTRPAALAAIAAAAILLAAVGILFASAHPDGLESLIAQLGLASRAQSLIATPLAAYEFTPFGAGWLSKASAGLLGLGLIYAVCAIFGRVLSRQRSA